MGGTEVGQTPRHGMVEGHGAVLRRLAEHDPQDEHHAGRPEHTRKRTGEPRPRPGVDRGHGAAPFSEPAKTSAKTGCGAARSRINRPPSVSASERARASPMP